MSAGLIAAIIAVFELPPVHRKSVTKPLISQLLWTICTLQTLQVSCYMQLFISRHFEGNAQRFSNINKTTLKSHTANQRTILHTVLIHHNTNTLSLRK